MAINSQVAVDAKTQVPADVACLWVPLASPPWILPSVAITEILTDTPKADDATPSWHLGWLPWRRQQIPVLAFEGLLQLPLATTVPPYRLGVFNLPTATHDHPTFALRFSGIPRLMRLTQNDISPKQADNLPTQAEQFGSWVEVQGNLAFLPDLQAIHAYIWGQSLEG
jgi:chemosensory pili system protein ChpC